MASAAGSKKRRDVRGTDDEMCACVSFALSLVDGASSDRLARSRTVFKHRLLDY